MSATDILPNQVENEVHVSDGEDSDDSFDCLNKDTNDSDVENEKSDCNPNEEIIYRCKHCPLTFTNKSKRNKHKRKVHGLNIPKGNGQCSICGQRMCPTSLKRHRDTFHPTKKNTNEELESMMRNELECIDCGITLQDYLHFQRHLKEVHPDGYKRYECPVCKQRYRTKPLLKQHFYNHTGMKQFQCKHCDKSYNDPSQMKIHERSHTEKLVFQCKYCGEVFCSNPSLEKHLFKKVCDRTKRVIPSEKIYQCLDCEAKFDEHVDFVKHTKTHPDYKNYKCEICAARMISTAHLKIHMRVHTGERPFECDLCGKTFTDKGNMRRHRRIHTDEKPYECQFCEEKFKDHTTWQAHENKHKTDGTNVTKTSVEKEKECDTEITQEARQPPRQLLPAPTQLPSPVKQPKPLTGTLKSFFTKPQKRKENKVVEQEASEENDRLPESEDGDKENEPFSPPNHKNTEDHANNDLHQQNANSTTAEEIGNIDDPPVKLAKRPLENTNSPTNQKRLKIESTSDESEKIKNQTALTTFIRGKDESLENEPKDKIIHPENKSNIEKSAIPLAVMLNVRGVEEKKELLVIWLKKLDLDVLTSVNLFSSKCLIVLKNFDLLEEPARIRSILKDYKAQTMNFMLLENSNEVSQWTVISLGGRELPLTMKNKLLPLLSNAEEQIEKEVENTELIHLIRHSDGDLYCNVTNQLKGKIIVCNYDT